MNTMQKVTAALSLLCVAVLIAATAVGIPDSGPSRRTLIILAVACGLMGAVLVAVFVRGDILARLRKGVIVVSLAAAAVTIVLAPLSTHRWVAGWRQRLTQYPALSKYAQGLGSLSPLAAMSALDSIIGKSLLSGRPDLWQEFGFYMVPCARQHSVSVEYVVAVVQRETAALRLPVQARSLSWRQKLRAVSGLGHRLRYDDSARVVYTARKYHVTEDSVMNGVVENLPSDSEITSFAVRCGRTPAGVVDFATRLNSVVDAACWDVSSGRRIADTYSPPEGRSVSVPNWPAKLALAGSELLAGLALVIVLGLFRRKPKQTGNS